MTEKFEPAIEVEGSLFKFLGFENHEVDAKGDLLVRFYKAMRARGRSKSQLAEALKLDKGEVSKLIKGNLDRFSIERMMRMLRDLGTPVRITWVDEPVPAFTEPAN